MIILIAVILILFILMKVIDKEREDVQRNQEQIQRDIQSLKIEIQRHKQVQHERIKNQKDLPEV